MVERESKSPLTTFSPKLYFVFASAKSILLELDTYNYHDLLD